MVHTLDIINAKKDVLLRTVKNILAATLLFLALFDEHLTALFSLEMLPLAEVIVLAILPLALLSPLAKQKISWIDLSILLLLLIIFLVGLAKTTFLHSFLGTIFLFKTLIIFMAGSLLAGNSSDLINFMKAIFWLAVISGIVTFLQVFFPLNPLELSQDKPGLVGITSNPNKNGLLLVIGFILSSLVVKKSAFVRYTVIFFFFASVLLSQSRQGVLIFGVIFFLQEILIHKRMLLLIIFLLVLTVMLVFFPEQAFYRFAEIERIIETGNYFRLKALIASFEVVGDYPLLGAGPGMFGGAVANVLGSPIHDQYSVFAHWASYSPDNRPSTIDMYWPHVWAEIGILGTVVFAGVIVRIIYLQWKGFQQTLHPAYKASALMIILVILAGFFSMSMESTFLSMLVFIFAGMLVKTPMPVTRPALGVTESTRQP